MVPEDRKKIILDALGKYGYLSVLDLSKLCFVSVPTIRRDLTALEKEGSLKRTHGGASYVSETTVVSPFSLRNRVHIEEKRKIGRLAARLLHNGATVFIDSSSTCYEFARSIPSDMKLFVLTNAVRIASELAFHEHIRVELPGGDYEANHESIFGDEAARFVRSRYADFCFLSCVGADAAHGITGSLGIDTSVKKAMCEQAKRTVLLCDHSKMEKAYYFHLLSWRQIDCMVTDSPPPESIRQVCEKNEVELIVPTTCRRPEGGGNT